MNKEVVRGLLLVLVANVAIAQTEDSDPEQDPPESDKKTEEKIERMSVTGSRIQKTGADEVSKIEISREEAELVAPSGDVAQVPNCFLEPSHDLRNPRSPFVVPIPMMLCITLTICRLPIYSSLFLVHLLFPLERFRT